jgi:hypothetical protein
MSYKRLHAMSYMTLLAMSHMRLNIISYMRLHTMLNVRLNNINEIHEIPHHVLHTPPATKYNLGIYFLITHMFRILVQHPTSYIPHPTSHDLCPMSDIPHSMSFFTLPTSQFPLLRPHPMSHVQTLPNFFLKFSP